MAHEDAYLAHLEAQGVSVLNLRAIDDAGQALAETRTAMEKGVEAIAQATLANGRWFGRSDILRRVERASRLGSWCYEVYDCKLACETKAATILQLALYCELLESIQGVVPESMYVDSVMTRWSEYPAMHIYHFTPYEPSALKRLMGTSTLRGWTNKPNAMKMQI